MQWTINKLKRTIFLLITRYCGTCLKAFWLIRVNQSKKGEALCPSCLSPMWYTKQNAQEEHENKK